MLSIAIMAPKQRDTEKEMKIDKHFHYICSPLDLIWQCSKNQNGTQGKSKANIEPLKRMRIFSHLMSAISNIVDVIKRLAYFAGF